MADTGEDVKQDIAGPIQKVYNWVSSKFDVEKPAGTKKVDQGYHDDMLKKANESFKPETTKLADRKPLGQKTTKKKSGSKQTARKR